jgi:23S rRNA (cytosine1962-C5)-methyltransferase
MYPKVTLKSERDSAVRGGHPWVFSGAVERADSGIGDGDLVSVVGAGGHFLGHGYFNGRSAIRVRILSREPEREIDGGFWRERVERAVALRRGWFDDTRCNAYRLINGEGDGLPGLVADRFGACVVVQFHTLGMETRRDAVLGALRDALMPGAIVERSDLEVRRKEGLTPTPPRLLEGELPSGGVEIVENELRYRVDPLAGQKTGFFLDQRENRAAVGRLAAGRRVLNAFAYTGGFTLAALRGGATEAISVESSAPALAALQVNLALNGLDAGSHQSVGADVGDYLEQAVQSSRRFDLVILDPPAFVKQRAGLESGLKAYRRLNRQALHLLSPGGILVTACCSSHVSVEDWEGVVFMAARTEGRSMQVLRESFHPLDHPVLLQCPEGRYLKCLIVRALD